MTKRWYIVLVLAFFSYFLHGMEQLDLRQKIDDIASNYRIVPRWMEPQSETIQHRITSELVYDLAFPPHYSLFPEQEIGHGGELPPVASMDYATEFSYFEPERKMNSHVTQIPCQPSIRSSVPHIETIRGWLYKDDGIFPFVAPPDMANDVEIKRFQRYLDRNDVPSLAHEIKAQQANLENTSVIDRFNRYKISRRLSFIAKHVGNNPVLHYLLLIHTASRLEEACDGVVQLSNLLRVIDSIKVNGQTVALTEEKTAELMHSARRLVERRTDYQAEQRKYPAATIGGQLLERSPLLITIERACAVKKVRPVHSTTSSTGDVFTDALSRKIHINPLIDAQLVHALSDIQNNDRAFKCYLDATVDRLKEMQKHGLLTPSPDLVEHGIKHFCSSLVPNNPLENPKEFSINVIRYTALAALHVWTGGWLVPMQLATEIGLKLHALIAVDTATWTPHQYAEFIAEQLADIVYTMASTKLVSKVKTVKVPEKFVRLTGELFKGKPTHEVVDTHGQTQRVLPHEMTEQLHLQENANKQNLQKNIGKKEVVEQPIEWVRYPKHIPPPHVKEWKKIVKLTKNSEALYHPSVNIRELELYVWKHGKQVTIPGKNYKVYKFDKVIGANSGKETCYIRVECTGGFIHGHPILESRYLGYLKNEKL